MSRPSNHRAARTLAALLSTIISLTLVMAGAVQAQDDAATFEAAVTEARDTAAARIDAAMNAIGEEAASLVEEAALIGPIADNLPEVAAALDDYAAVLSALDVPDELIGEVEQHLASLRELVAETTASIDAASAGDGQAASDAEDRVASILAQSAAEMDSEYAAYAFVSSLPFIDFLGSFGSSTPEELEYLEGVIAARNEFETRNRQFGQVISQSYPSTEALLAALYEAGAGTAFAAVREKAATLQPPEHLTDEHQWWLARVGEQVRLDGLIGESMRDGDVIGFVANNIRLGLLESPYPELDPSFGEALAPGSPIGARLDVSNDVGRTEYGQALFDALRGPGSAEVVDSIETSFFRLPTTPDQAMEAVAQTGPELEAAISDLADAVNALVAPDAYAADQQVIVDYVADESARLAEVIQAAAAGDADATFAAIEALKETYCAAAASLSSEIVPVTSVYFEAGAPFCGA